MTIGGSSCHEPGVYLQRNEIINVSWKNIGRLNMRENSPVALELKREEFAFNLVGKEKPLKF